MYNNQEVTLVRSSFLRKQREDEQKYKLIHLVSGRQFSVDEDTINVLDYFKNPKVIKDGDLSANMKASIEYMVKSGLLIHAEELATETYHRTSKSHALFGFRQYEELDQENQVVFIGVPFGGGNHASSGTGRFPGFLREYLHKHNLRLSANANPDYHFLGNNREIHQLETLVKEEKVRDAGDIFIHHFEPKREVYDKIKHLSGKVIQNNKVPFSIGGDHSISYPIIASIAERYESFNVLHFDAHTDVYDSYYQSILDNNGLHHHGNFVSKCLELDNLKKYYQFGIRGINNAFHRTNSDKLEVYWADYLKSILYTLEEIDLPEDEYYYITFDIDVLDPCVAPGTATPIPNGFSFSEVIQLFRKLKLQNKKIIGIDFVEVNKEKDPLEMTMSLSAQLILNLLNFIKVK